MYKKILIFTIPFIVAFNLDNLKDEDIKETIIYPLEYLQQEYWVDSVFNSLTPDEKIGQLFMVAAYSNKDETHYQEIEKLVNQHKIGGLIFFQGNPYQQALLTNRYQAKSKVPLMIAMDAEWGLGMRLDSTLSYPKQMTLGALQNDSLIYEMGKQVAEQCKLLGVQVNFAPVVDINSNPLNPVIGYRSFGEDKNKVARKGIMYMHGMQKNGILANAKHFPGHGDTKTDSHYDLPVIKHSKKRLSEIELYPFKELIREGVSSMMVAHIQVKKYDNKKNRPATLSQKIVTDLLKKELGFTGLIFTDALNMKGVTKFYQPGEADVMALLAGNDVLLFPTDVAVAIDAIKKSVQLANEEEEARKQAEANGEKFKKSKIETVKQDDINEKVKKILRAKYKTQLAKYKPIQTKNLTTSLNQDKYKTLIDKLYQKSITLVKSQDNLIPFQNLDTTKFASLAIGGEFGGNFQTYLSNYTSCEKFTISAQEIAQASIYEKLLPELSKKTVVVVGILGMNKWQNKNYGVDPKTITFLEELQKQTKVVVTVFGIPYSLELFKNINHLICAYEENEATTRIAPQLLFGAYGFEGKLPVSIGVKKKTIFKIQDGITTSPLNRLSYTSPESALLDAEKLAQMDAIIKEAIDKKMAPGMQVLVARKGQIAWQKAYGFYDYSKKQPVTNESIYDLASITKVAATLQVIMKLYEEGKIDLDKKVAEYLPELQKSNKKEATIREVLLHEAGLQPYILFWQNTVDKKGKLSDKYYSSTYSAEFPHKVADNIYAVADMEEQMWQWIIDSKMLKAYKGKYAHKYSDLSFYILKRIAESIINEPIESYLYRTVYNPMGLSTLCFNPWEKFDISRMTPTENEKTFRRQLIQGYVHDPGAAMLGGVGGHAGLFGTANDLAKLVQMNLQKGQYGGKQYFSEETLNTFSASVSKTNHRGLGWDKPPVGSVYSYIPSLATESSYGHSGFTGTVVWVDPEYDLVIIILANRIHPDLSDDYVKNHIRRKIQDVVYDAMTDVKLNKPKQK